LIPVTQDPFIEAVLDRPDAERLREYRHRCAQSLIFGLPVLGLELFGQRLGGPNAHLPVGGFQAILAGWIILICVTPMLIHGFFMLVRRRLTGELVIGICALSLYALAGARWVESIHGYIGGFLSAGFSWAVIIVAVWSGFQWWRFSKRAPGTYRR